VFGNGIALASTPEYGFYDETSHDLS